MNRTTVVTSEAETASMHSLVQHLCSSLVFGLIPIPQSLVFCAVFCLAVTCVRSVAFSGTPVFSTNKIDHHYIVEILLKVASNTITLSI
jgi:hypothetical protein